MSTLLTERRPRRVRGRAPARQAALFAAPAPSLLPGIVPSLDDVVSRGWEGLTVGVPMGCPVCGGELAPLSAGGRCGDCGSVVD